ncbi:MAG: hypothetical protein SGI99_05555 [Pseudomonadota bacterium]|nr:hypothetical protein [Pseudomonadota bacterium]
MNSIITLLIAVTLGAGEPGALVPLTPIEAANLGLDSSYDGMMYRTLDAGAAIDSPHAEQIEGMTQSLTLSPRDQRGASNEVFFNDTADGRWCELGSSNAFGDIVLMLPHGTTVTSMRIWGFDTNATNNMTVSLIERCTPNNVAGSVFTSVIAEITASANSGNFSQVTAIGANNSIDTDACSYTLRTRYSTPGEINFCAGNTLRLQKIRMGFTP